MEASRRATIAEARRLHQRLDGTAGGGSRERAAAVEGRGAVAIVTQAMMPRGREGRRAAAGAYTTHTAGPVGVAGCVSCGSR